MMSQTLSNGDKVSITLTLDRNILDRLEVERIVKGDKKTSTMFLSDYNIKADLLKCQEVPNLDSIAILKDNASTTLSLFVWQYDEEKILYKVRTMVGDTVKGILSADTYTTACKLKGRPDVWFSSSVGP